MNGGTNQPLRAPGYRVQRLGRSGRRRFQRRRQGRHRVAAEQYWQYGPIWLMNGGTKLGMCRRLDTVARDWVVQAVRRFQRRRQGRHPMAAERHRNGIDLADERRQCADLWRRLDRADGLHRPSAGIETPHACLARQQLWPSRIHHPTFSGRLLLDANWNHSPRCDDLPGCGSRPLDHVQLPGQGLHQHPNLGILEYVEWDNAVAQRSN